jgi:peptide/nickel transport system substrate-binding protein
MKSMRKTAARAAVVVTALALALTACSSGGGSKGVAKGDGSSLTVEAADGVPSSFKGTLPKPEIGKAYNNPQDRDNVKDGGTLTLGTVEVGPNWNSQSVDGNSLYMGTFWQYYMPQLWNYDVSGNPTPNPDYLTKVEVTSEDPLVVTYDINPKAKWNDGTDIDWTAFKTTWETQGNASGKYNPASTSGYDQVKSVEQGANAKQVVVTFDKPFYPYQFLFANIEHPKNADAKFYAEGWVNDPHAELGAGPFTVDSSDETQVTFVPNPNWWGNKPKLDKVVFKQMEDQAEINAFQNGELDAAGVANADRLKIARGMKDIQIRINYGLSTSVFTLNTKAESLKDLAVRKALTQSIDRKKLAEIRFNGLDWDADPAGSEIMLPFQDGYEDNMPADSAYSPDNAKKTLEAAGYALDSKTGFYAKDGKPVHVTYTYFGDDPTQIALGNAIQAMGKAGGIEIEIVNLDSSKFSDTLTNYDYELLGMGWSASDPFGYSTSGCQLYCSDSGSNFAQIGTAEIDELMKKPGSIEDIPAAVKALNEAEKKALEQYGTFPNYFSPVMTAVKKGLANFGAAGFQGLNLHPENIGWQK